MAKFKLEFDEKKYVISMDHRIKLISQHIANALKISALLVESEIKNLLSEGGQGEVYEDIFRNINGKVVPVGPRTGNNLSASHRASKAGDSPASDTGNLRRGIQARDVNISSGRGTVAVASTAPYSVYLEYGTSQMEPRPFMRPGLRNQIKNILNELKKAVNKSL